MGNIVEAMAGPANHRTHDSSDVQYICLENGWIDSDVTPICSEVLFYCHFIWKLPNIQRLSATPLIASFFMSWMECLIVSYSLCSLRPQNANLIEELDLSSNGTNN